MSKFMNLNVEVVKDSNTRFFDADNLRAAVQSPEETKRRSLTDHTHG